MLNKIVTPSCLRFFYGNSRVSFVLPVLFFFVLSFAAPVSAQEAAPRQDDVISVTTPEEPLGAYQEAPSLAALVAAGELPPVEERLPENPPIVIPFEEIGQYGGTMRLVDSISTSFSAAGVRFMEEGLFARSAPSAQFTYANLAESLEISDDLQTFTIHLRPGVKWSDGTPLTSADFIFHWNDVVRYSPDPSVNSASLIPGDMYVGGEPITLEAPDDFTLIMRTAAPYSEYYRALAQFSTPARFGPSPFHYLEQFHPKYTEFEDPIEAWNEFRVKNALTNPERPGIGAWIIDEFTEGERVVLTRNPYYWKVDSEGKQLPYIDQVTGVYVGDAEVLTLQLASGAYDFMYQGVPLSPVMFQEQERGNYRMIPNPLVRHVGLKVNLTWMALNDDTEEFDPLVELFKNSEFIHALQLGLDNERFTTAYAGAGLEDFIGTTFGSVVLHVYSELANSDDPRAQGLMQRRREWARYDVDEANRILDELGLTIGSDGYRQYPGGGRIEIAVGSYTDWQPVGEITEVAAGALEENLKIKFNVETRPYAQAVEDFYVGYAVPLAGADFVGLYFVNNYIRIDYLAQNPVADWVRTNGATGVEPWPEIIEPFERLWALASEAATTTDVARRTDLTIQVAEIMEEYQLDYPLTLGGRIDHFFAHNRITNIPYGFPHWASERFVRMEQWWINE